MTSRTQAKTNKTGKALLSASKELSNAVDQLSFSDPVAYVYNPLKYAWPAHQEYLHLAPESGTKVVFLGMNPGPWGMTQTGVPFGEIEAVRDWLKIKASIGKPSKEHPKRIVEGFQCSRSEVSGRRLWGLFRDRYGTAKRFFKHHFVANYCPLVFMEESGRNRTPDKLPREERTPLDQLCDQHLGKVLRSLNPQYAVAVGIYAEKCLQRVLAQTTKSSTQLSSANLKPSVHLTPQIVRILHPSPASPAANKDWAGTVEQQLIDAGVWSIR